MDPSFVFEENSASAALKALKAQPAWELGEAIEEARAVKHKTKTFTTTDEKIRKRLEGKNETNETNETTSAAAAKKKKKKKKTSGKKKDKTDSGSFFAEELKTARNSNESSAGSGSGSFLELNLSRVLCKACGNLGYETPTPVQVSHQCAVSLYESLFLSLSLSFILVALASLDDESDDFQFFWIPLLESFGTMKLQTTISYLTLIKSSDQKAMRTF